jgi:hypothetical protein
MQNEEELPYWKARTVDAVIACQKEETPINCEELAFTRVMVKLLESELSIGKVVE